VQKQTEQQALSREKSKEKKLRNNVSNNNKIYMESRWALKFNEKTRAPDTTIHTIHIYALLMFLLDLARELLSDQTRRRGFDREPAGFRPPERSAYPSIP
jgi:hypothetical protein